MHEATEDLTFPSPATAELAADAGRAQAWAGEPFLHPGEDTEQALAPGTARRHALDDALAEIDAGRKTPSPRWKVRYGLMLGLERILSDKPPRLASGTELRRHQIDALAGMLTELIAANQRPEELNGNGALLAEVEPEEDEDDFELDDEAEDDEEPELAVEEDPGREAPLPLPASDRLGEDDRGRRLRRGGAHARRPDPHAPPSARLAVRPRAEGGGLRRPADPGDRAGQGAAAEQPGHDPDLRVVRAPRRHAVTRGVPARHRRRGAHRPRREDERSDPVVPRADLHRHDRDRAADRQAGLGRLPRVGRRPAARRRRAPRADRAAARPARAAGRGDPLGADRRRRLRRGRARQGARPRSAEPGRRVALPRPLRLASGHRLRRRRRSRLQPGEGVPRRRPQGRGRERTNAAGQARRDAGRLRARRDQRPHQRDAARRGLELPARDRRDAPRADRLEARVPAADRPHHAPASAQGGGHRRRLRAQVGDAQRPRRSRSIRCSTPTSTARARA